MLSVPFAWNPALPRCLPGRAPLPSGLRSSFLVRGLPDQPRGHVASRVRTPCTPSALAPHLGLASPGHGRQSPSTKVQAWRKQRLRPGRLVCKAKASAWRDNSHSVTLLGERMGLTTPPSSDSVARSCSLGPPGLWQRCRGGEEVFLPLGSVGLWGGTGRQWGGSFQPPRSGPLRGLWAFAPFTRASSPLPGVDGPSLVQRPGG